MQRVTKRVACISSKESVRGFPAKWAALLDSEDKDSKRRRDIASIFCVMCKIGEDDGATRDAIDGMDRAANAL